MENYEFSLDEIKALYRLLEFHYIPYQDVEGSKVVAKIAQIMSDNDPKLARKSSKPA